MSLVQGNNPFNIVGSVLKLNTEPIAAQEFWKGIHFQLSQPNWTHLEVGNKKFLRERIQVFDSIGVEIDPSKLDDYSKKFEMFKFHTVTTLIQKIIIGNVEQFRQLFQQESPLSSDYLATALQIATIFDNPEIVQILLQSGADPNLPTNSFKLSSFKCSLKWSSYNVIDLLFKAKPTNLDHVDANGLTMLDWAAVDGNTEMLKKLLELGASTRNALNFAAMNNQIEAINLLLDAGVDVNQKVPSGFTPLMSAANKGFNQSCSLLLSRGAKVNDIAKAGTALLNAIKEGHYETCKLLLVAGADPNLQSPEEKITPFLCSVHMNYPDISLLLLEYGANKNTPSADFTPLTACQLHQFPGYTKVIQELNLSITDIANGDYFKLTKLIAHACKIDGTSAYKSGETFERLGIAGTYLSRQWTKNLTLFSKTFSSAIPKTVEKQLRYALEGNRIHSHKHLIHKIDAHGSPTILLIKVTDHFVNAIIWNNMVVLCDRINIESDDGWDMPSVEIFRMDVENCKNLISKVSEGEMGMKEYLYFRNQLRLKSFIPKPEDFLIESTLSFPKQTVNNCQWASLEQSFFVFLVLATFENRGLDPKAFNSSYQPIVDEQRAVFDNFIAFQQLKFIEDYLKLDKDVAVDSRIIPLALKSIDTTSLYPELRQKHGDLSVLQNQ